MSDKTHKPASTNNPPTASAQPVEPHTNAAVPILEKINENDAADGGEEELLRFIAGTVSNIQQTLATNRPALTNISQSATADAVVTNVPATSQNAVPASPPTAFNPAQSSSNAPPDGSISPVTPQPIIAPTNSSMPFPVSTNPTGTNAPSDDSGFISSLFDSATSGSDTQLLQTSADQVRRAFEANSQVQLSLYQQLLEALEAQSQKMNDLERRTSELTNQIKSLKNP